MFSRVRFALRSAAILGVGAFCVWSVAGESRPVNEPAASLTRYDVAGGDSSFFALSVKAGSLVAATAHDHVILVDTSASQAGAHRQQAFDVLDSCLAALGEGDRIQLFAVDAELKPLTDGFIAPQSTEAKDALAKLHQRVPLGATNLRPALTSALKSFAGGDRGRSIIYIGDGMSTGKLLDFEELRGLLSELRKNQVPVNSFAVGPRIDLQLLGTFAVHTGGVVSIDDASDDSQLSAEALGRKLAAAADAAVFYPDRISVAPEVDRLLPGDVPPIRSDRDTILLGKGRIDQTMKVTASGNGRSLEWSVKPAAVQPGNTYLAGLWAMAEKTDGLAVAVAGSELLNIARQEYESQVEQLVGLGRRAVAARNLKDAAQIAQAVRQIDPANVEAGTILAASQKVKAAAAALARFQNDQAPPAAVEPPDAPGTARNPDLLAAEQNLRLIRAERLQKEVSRTIEAGRKEAARDPDAALGEMKRILTAVVSSTDIDPDVREKLRARLQATIDQILVTKQKIDINRIQNIERSAAAEARDLAVDQLVQRDEQIEQLIDKVRSLMTEGFIGNAEAFEKAEEVARASFELAPYSGVTNAAIFDSEAAGQLDKAQRLRYLRNDKFLATLYQVELSHVPFPDEPPIVYPAPEVWKALTERRQKWASVDLVRYNPTEEKIRRALSQPTTVEFLDLPLEDAITFLKEFHNINIFVDKPTLTDEGVALDQPITLKLAGVSLRSVLKLLLEPVQLTYVIEDEVMKITTSAKAGEKLSTRVYPVGDLVIPIITPMGGGMMGGGMGGMGGGMMGGGMGGMGGGMMGGMGGMGGGMGGMGMMNVADPIPASLDTDEFNNDTVKNRKKKV